MPPALNVLDHGGLDLGRAYGGPVAGIQVAAGFHLHDSKEQD